MTTRRRLDKASAALLLIGATCDGWSYWLVTERGWNVLIAVPAIVATTTGAAHLFQRTAPRG